MAPFQTVRLVGEPVAERWWASKGGVHNDAHCNAAAILFPPPPFPQLTDRKGQASSASWLPRASLAATWTSAAQKLL